MLPGYNYHTKPLKHLKINFNALMLRAAHIRPARYTKKATPAGLDRINPERVPLFFVLIFENLFSSASSRARLVLKVAKGSKSRYSRSRLASKVTSRCAKKSLARA
jgi:hypothetical protein